MRGLRWISWHISWRFMKGTGDCRTERQEGISPYSGYSFSNWHHHLLSFPYRWHAFQIFMCSALAIVRWAMLGCTNCLVPWASLHVCVCTGSLAPLLLESERVLQLSLVCQCLSGKAQSSTSGQSAKSARGERQSSSHITRGVTETEPNY